MTDKLWEAFVAGFKASGEGFNGEYPFSDKGKDVAESTVVRAAFDKWLGSQDARSGDRNG